MKTEKTITDALMGVKKQLKGMLSSLPDSSLKRNSSIIVVGSIANEDTKTHSVVALMEGTPEALVTGLISAVDNDKSGKFKAMLITAVGVMAKLDGKEKLTNKLSDYAAQTLVSSSKEKDDCNCPLCQLRRMGAKIEVVGTKMGSTEGMPKELKDLLEKIQKGGDIHGDRK